MFTSQITLSYFAAFKLSGLFYFFCSGNNRFVSHNAESLACEVGAVLAVVWQALTKGDKTFPSIHWWCSCWYRLGVLWAFAVARAHTETQPPVHQHPWILSSRTLWEACLKVQDFTCVLAAFPEVLSAPVLQPNPKSVWVAALPSSIPTIPYVSQYSSKSFPKLQRKLMRNVW